MVGTNKSRVTPLSLPEREAEKGVKWADRVDAVLDNIVYLLDAVERQGNQDLTMAGPLVKGGIMATDTCIGVRKGETDLKAQLDKAIQAAIADGTVRTLAMKWFKLDVSPKS
jgi:octopine/nopaline transport system substrate-binding protein